MIFGRVSGTVTATVRGDTIPGARFLLVESADYTGKGKKSYLVALDSVGANRGEVVLISQGSSARQTEITDKTPIDAVIVAIIDEVEEGGRSVFRK